MKMAKFASHTLATFQRASSELIECYGLTFITKTTNKKQTTLLFTSKAMINVRFFNTSGENIFLKKGTNDRKTEFEGLKFGLS